MKPVKHPHPDDNGKAVTIERPTKPSAPESWNNPGAVASFVPGGDVPQFMAWPAPLKS
ncbi:MAG: hypothetical protein FWD77_09645 [Betaproteobacteria bacterium]|nr:hypothetical protein [Betaproteobacteria bacterium]